MYIVFETYFGNKIEFYMFGEGQSDFSCHKMFSFKFDLTCDGKISSVIVVNNYNNKIHAIILYCNVADGRYRN